MRLPYYPIRPEVLEANFWKKCEPEPNSGCWIWIGAYFNHGRGVVGRGGKSRLASRVAWEYARGPIPDGFRVLHKCDTPACINPAHLFLGTQRDNMRDCTSKGRFADKSGMNNGRAKITEDDVREIRRLYGEGVSQAELARRFGLSTSPIHDIVRHHHWVGV